MVYGDVCLFGNSAGSQVGRGPGQPDLLAGNLAHGRELELVDL